MSTEMGPAGENASSGTGSPSKPVPGRGKILIWSVHFAPRDPNDPNEPTPDVTASVTLDDQDGVVVSAKAARVIDYQSGVISRGATVEVRYESPEDETSDNPVWVFDLVAEADSNVVDEADPKVS